MIIRRAWFVASLLSLQGLISAQSSFSLADVPIDTEATARANRFQRVMIQPKQVFKNVKKLTKSLMWHKNLKIATAAAE